MSLQQYRKKRQFDKTPEPKGTKSPRSRKKLEFVVQEHHARALHYDFRLELDGVLKSWAVPKGPSMNPHDHHLAVQTEDHPYEYRKFEGEIPEGNYGAGSVIIWDKGTYEARGGGGEAELRAGLKKGHITFVLHGEKLNGEFALIQFHGSDDDKAWLLIKKGDDEASTADILRQNRSVISGKKVDDIGQHAAPRAALPTRIVPMLCTLIDAPFSRPGWFFEIKWDGYRAIGSKKKQDIELYSRNGLDFRTKFAPVVEALRLLKDDVVLDGEIVAVGPEGHAHFEWLQNWKTAPQGELRYYVFDILWHNGRDLTPLPLRERKKILRQVLPKKSLLFFSDDIEEHGEALYKEAAKAGLEGVVAKRADSPYRPGIRGQDWLKIKTHLRQETVIAGFSEPRGTRKYLGSLLLGVYDKGELRYVGHSGGGFAVEAMKQLRHKLDKLEVKTPPFKNPPKVDATTHWVKPELVCEVSFSEWTSEGMMRQPTFEGMREDKAPHNVHKEIAKTKKADEHASLPGSKVAFSHLGKMFWPKHGYTKGDLIGYYQSVGDVMLKYLKDRPESLNRQPNGVGSEGFFQKDINFDLPPYAASKKLYSESTRQDIDFLICNNVDTLLYMAQLGCIEINPWSSRLKSPDNPDWAVMDLDPEGVGFDTVIQVAQTVHAVCDDWGVPALPKTSGKTGIHIFIPLGAKYSYEQARQFTQLIAIEVNNRLPKITSIERSPEKRKHRLYLDYLQNSRGQTLAAPYSVRPTPDATVSMPLEWKEVNDKLLPTDFTIKNALKRLDKKGDLWAPTLGKGADLKKILATIDHSS